MMDENPIKQKPVSIVVGVDYSELGDLAVRRAYEVANAYQQSHLHVVHVDRSLPRGIQDTEEATQKDVLARASKKLRDRVEMEFKQLYGAGDSPVPFERLTIHIRSEEEAKAIAQLASDVEADLIIVGMHGRTGARRFLLGSVAESIVRRAPCSVLVVRPNETIVPSIEPPCPRCLETRRATDGAQFWCDQHSEQDFRKHVYHFSVSADPHQSGFLIHTEGTSDE